MQKINSRPFSRYESGQALVLIVLLLTVLLGVAGLALDGGLLYHERRKAQNAADNAALAGAFAICDGGNVILSAYSAANENGYDNDGATNWVKVYHPPISGSAIGDSEYVEVVVRGRNSASFSQFIFSGPLESTSRAVAQCSFGEGGPVGWGNALITMHPDTSGALEGSGSASVVVAGGGIFVNSEHEDKAVKLSGSASITSDTFEIVGGYDLTGSATVDPSPTTGVSPISDPLPAVEPPSKPGGSPIDYKLNGGGSDTIGPGLYKNIKVSGGSSLTLEQGIYYIEGGEFSASGGSSVEGEGVLIYLDEGKVDLSGGGTFDLSPPTSGEYQGLLFYLDRDNTSEIHLSSSSSSVTAGTIYAIGSQFKLSGSSGSLSLGSQIIVGNVKITGDASINIDYDPDDNYGSGENAKFIGLTN